MSGDNLSTCISWTQPPKCFITLEEESQSRADYNGWNIAANFPQQELHKLWQMIQWFTVWF